MSPVPAPRLPPPAGPGDRVGVAALSGPVDPGRLERGLAALAALGFEPVPARNLASRRGFLAGSDAERLDAFHELAADPDVAAILFARGGHGLLRVLPAVDWDLLARRPRAYVGLSDLTPFLLEVVRRLGLVAFHGPMVAADLARGMSPEDEASLLGALAGEVAGVEIPLGGWIRPPAPGQGAAGPLAGGCLSLLTAVLGTRFAPDLAGSLLFWEDVNEPAYRVDRMLTHLYLSDTLTGIQGMIVGHLDAEPPAGNSAAGGVADGPGGEWLEVIGEAVARFPWPVAWGLPGGHRAPNRTLPLGLPARLEGETPRLVLGEGP